MHLQHERFHIKSTVVIFILEPQLAHVVWIIGVVLAKLIDPFLLCSHRLHSLFSFSVFYPCIFDVVDLFFGEEVVSPVGKSIETWSVPGFDTMVVVKSADVLRIVCPFRLERVEPLSSSKCAWNVRLRFDRLNQLRNRGVLLSVLLQHARWNF